MMRLPVSHLTTEPTEHGCSFEQQLTVLDEALLAANDSVRQILQNVRASVVRVRQELSDIHTSSLPAPSLAPAVCFDCGRKNLDVFYASKHSGYHLCEACFHAREDHSQARRSHASTDTAF